MSVLADRKLFLHLSNRMELLAAQLAEELRQEQGDPLVGQTVVVSSIGTARWVSMQVASANGISMGLRFPFPRAVIDELLDRILPGKTLSRRFSRDSMGWWIFETLPQFLDHPCFSAVRSYLADGDPSKRYQLARRVAALLDQYQVYRPEMIRSWEASDHSQDWQQQLWLELRRSAPGELAFTDLLQAASTLEDAQLAHAGLPSRLHVFGLNTIPPSFLDLLWKIGSVTQVDFYLLSPTDQYWGDLVSKKKAARMGTPDSSLDGNPLVASMGRLSRDLLNQLLDLDFQQASERFEVPTGGTLLAELQRDFHALTDRTRLEEKWTVPDQDDSIRIHSCHSPMREVEVLQDHLLSLFQANPTLRARDVLVMAPDIDQYAPFIEAVFGAPETAELRIPYSLADQKPRSEFAVIDAFLRILELAVTSRFEAGAVLGVLEFEPIRQHFSLTETDLERIRRWVRECGVIWAMDGAHRQRLGFDPDPGFSWAQGRSTLLDGYAMNGSGFRLSGRVLPYEDMEGDQVETLERFLQAFDVLVQIAGLLQESRSRTEWADQLALWAVRLFGDESACAMDLRTLQAAFTTLRLDDLQGVLVDPSVLLDSLRHTLGETTTARGYLDGRVTFCSLKPMRSIPAPVICLLGMNDADFPRLASPQAFDLMAGDPRPGDRSVRDDDRHLFLETLLSVRQHLYISYCGQSSRSLSVAPPSVVVCEMLDYIRGGFAIPVPVGKRLDCRHRLQAFHPDYFGPGILMGYSRENLQAALRLQNPPISIPKFFDKTLPEPDEEFRTVSPDQLAEFFVNPARYLCEKRLGIRINRDGESLPVHEPVRLEGIDLYQLQQDLVDSALRGDSRPHCDAAVARGKLPAGAFGTLTRESVQRTVDQFVAAVRARFQTDSVETVLVQQDLGLFRLRGVVGGLRGGTLGRFRCARIKAADLIRAWVHLVCLNLQRPGTDGMLLDREGDSCGLRPPDNPEHLATELLNLYWRGMVHPLEFFPQSSLEFALYQTGKKKARNPGPRVPFDRARGVWQGSTSSKVRAERDDPYFARVFGETPPMEEAFAEVSMAFYGALLQHQEGELP